MKTEVTNLEHRLSFRIFPGSSLRKLRLAFYGVILLLLGVVWVGGARGFAQSSSSSPMADTSDSIRGVVINSVTHEPISRALVFSPDNRFATLTNTEGHFEFALSKIDAASGRTLDAGINAGMQATTSNRPNLLMARKPGFRSDPNDPGISVQNEGSQDFTLALVPESLITGTVSLTTSEAPDSITLQVYRRQVLEGRAHWVVAARVQTTSDGQFRFADLPAGSYKLLTGELLDRDPLSVNARKLFGYPPVYYQDAADFESAETIQLSAGQTQTVHLSLTKQPYYRVKVPVALPASDAQENGVSVEVYAHAHKGPGFELGYNSAHRAIEGMLPNGTYTIAATSFGPNGMSGLQTITIKGNAIDGPAFALVPPASIPVTVKEEFTARITPAQRAGTLMDVTFSLMARAAI